MGRSIMDYAGGHAPKHRKGEGNPPLDDAAAFAAQAAFLREQEGACGQTGRKADIQLHHAAEMEPQQLASAKSMFAGM